MDIERGIRALLSIRASLKDDNDLSFKVARYGCQALVSVLDDFIGNVLKLERECADYKFKVRLKDDTIDEYMALVGDLEELDDEAREKIRAIVKEAHDSEN